MLGYNLQAQPFSEEDYDLLAIPLGELEGKSGFDFLDDFGCGESVPTGE